VYDESTLAHAIAVCDVDRKRLYFTYANGTITNSGTGCSRHVNAIASYRSPANGGSNSNRRTDITADHSADSDR
jgi:hypothetical protein